ncbi:hypothetical protein ISTM_272 [Insectomime virus]|uniref:Uncharacterized protein n=1 Tax=Tunisvirus fontaine2 TaxID=1421067 RepID=V9SFV1_9VIRU|nr:hypothetical protein D1R32_gp042 [Tunisvirus fontaine2]AHA46170.1 hypothetical protein ISTM_272 [Insectomime virus]AHC54759.1 hypothetical protein TNS_ORF41 [Tunisvirus fontaine2]
MFFYLSQTFFKDRVEGFLRENSRKRKENPKSPLLFPKRYKYNKILWMLKKGTPQKFRMQKGLISCSTAKNFPVQSFLRLRDENTEFFPFQDVKISLATLNERKHNI